MPVEPRSGSRGVAPAADAERPPSDRAPDAIDPIVHELQQAGAIQLMVPASTPMAKYWTPQRSVPSVSLGRIKPDKVTLDKLPDGPTEVDAADALTLVLGRRLGTRGLWDIYYASLLDASGEQRSGLVLKLIDLLQFPAEGRGNIQSTAARETSNVFQWFNLLEPLQGTIVPHSAGLFAHGTLYCMVFEDAGRELTHAEKMDEHVQ